MSYMEKCTIKSKKINNGVLWFEIDRVIEEPVIFELKYLDVDNNKTLRTWTQVIKCEYLNAVLKREYVGIKLSDLKFNYYISGVEIRIILEKKKLNLTYDGDDSVIDIFSFSNLRNTLFITLLPYFNNKYISHIEISEGLKNDKVLLSELTDIDDFLPVYFCLQKRYSIDSNQGAIVTKEVIKNNEKWTVSLNKKIYGNSSQEDCTLDCYIDYRHKDYDYSILVPLRIEHFEYDIQASGCEIKWYRTVQGTLACYVKNNNVSDVKTEQIDNENIKKVKVATWGSCYTRNMFQSFYNDNWRRVIDVCDSYFWFSAISATSDKCDRQEFKIFEDKASEKNIQNVNREINKKTFDYLKESGAEYLLIDFYADAVAGVRRINDTCYIGQGVALSPDMQLSDLYEDIVQCNYKKVDYRNADYWDIWTYHCKLLNQRLEQFGYSKNVILIEGTFVTKFKDSDSHIIDYKDIEPLRNKLDLNNLKAREGLWYKMNEYYKKLNPNCKVLSMQSYNYLGDRDNKLLGPNHFEPNYYKSEFAELCKLILMDKIS